MRRTILDFIFRRKKRGHASLNRPSFSGALERLKARRIPVNTVLDVGASDGCWSRDLMRVYPHARYHCIEAQAPHEPGLRQFAAEHSNVSYVLAAAGAEEGQIHFDATALLGGIASHTPLGQNGIVVPMTTLDIQVAKLALAPPFLIKLDTHGFEIPILNGATATLAQSEVLIIEAYNFKIAPTAVLFYELCQFLEGKGFRCIDLYDPAFRARDHAFWQMDLVFARATRPEFQSPSFT